MNNSASGIITALLICMCVPVALHGEQASSIDDDGIAPSETTKHIRSSLRLHTETATLKDNPDNVPQGSKMELALNLLTGSVDELRLSNEDVDVLVSTNRSTEGGARAYDEYVTARPMAAVRTMCEGIKSGQSYDLLSVLETMNEIQDMEQEDARAYWNGVLSRLSSNGQESYSATYNSLASNEGIAASSSRLDWAGFGAQNPEYMAEWLDRICVNFEIVTNTPQNYDPATRILSWEGK